MKRLPEILLFILIQLLGSYYFIRRVDHYFALDATINLAVFAFMAFVFYMTVVDDYAGYQNHKHITSFIPTITTSAIMIALVVQINLLTHRDDSPSVLLFKSTGTDFSGTFIDFRQDDTYKLTSSSMGEDIYRGRYIKRDSVIILENSPGGGILKSNRLVLKRNQDQPVYGEINKHMYLYQIDNTGKVIDYEHEFIEVTY